MKKILAIIAAIIAGALWLFGRRTIKSIDPKPTLNDNKITPPINNPAEKEISDDAKLLDEIKHRAGE